MKNLIFLLLLLGVTTLSAQLAPFVSTTPAAAQKTHEERRAVPAEATFYELPAPERLGKALLAAPWRDEFRTAPDFLLEIPDPEGAPHTFRILRYRMVPEALEAHLGGIITAQGWDVAAPQRRVSVTWSANGFKATVLGGQEGRWLFNPLIHRQTKLYQSYFAKDYRAKHDHQNHGYCAFEEDEALTREIRERVGDALIQVEDCQLREYRLALACTAEYFNRIAGKSYSGTTPPALTAADTTTVTAEMINAINNVNLYFNRDLALQLNIINLPANGNIQLVYAGDTLQDPYTDFSGGLMLAQNQAEIDNVIGSANYDIGHVFSTGGGGIASLASVCQDDNPRNDKAKGVTGLPNPIGNPFYVDFVAHEFGHQFGGNHTFNSTEFNCAQRERDAAYEPGSGTTIQAYAGICGPDANIQLNSDAYYHAKSIQEIAAYMEAGGDGAGCATISTQSNTAPSVTPNGTSYKIPTNTPFVLDASGSDADGDALSYCWEQFDLGAVVAGEPTGSEPDGPLFRSLPPTADSKRYFPPLANVVAGTDAPWHALPLVSRDMTFIVTLRDNAPGEFGCPVQAQVDVEVINTGSQYAVMAPNGGEVWSLNGTETVTWDVAGTDAAAGINCSMVDILLSTDGGATFPTSLGTFPNNGSASVSTTGLATTASARIMVMGNGNIFYDVSNADFSIEQTQYTLTGVNTQASICQGENAAVFSVDLTSTQGYTGTIDLSLTGLPGGAGSNISIDPVVFDQNNINTTQTPTITLSDLTMVPTGSYTITLTADDNAGQVESVNLLLSVGQGAVVLTEPDEDALIQIDDPDNVVSFGFVTVPGYRRYNLSISFRFPNGSGYTASRGIIYNGDPASSNGSITFDFDDVVINNNSFAPVDGSTVDWLITAVDVDGANPDQVSCERRFTFVSGLPVDWLSFTARVNGKTARLNWTVNQDELHEGFSVQRTTDPAAYWTDIAYVEALPGRENVAYSLTDREVNAEGTYYYRLRQNDLDGSFSFSDVQTVTFTAESLSAFPNPTTGQLHISLGAEVPRYPNYRIYNTMGQLVMEGRLTARTTTLDLGSLPAATYQVVVTGDQDYRQLTRVIKR